MKNKRELNTIELTVESLAFEGAGIARNEGLVYFVEGGLPGDRIVAEVVRKKKSFVEARIRTIIEPSPARIEPPCPYFVDCGGCSLQNLDYGEQLRWKRQFVVDSFERIGKLHGLNILPTLDSPIRFRYRNKMEYSFSASRWISDEEILTTENIEQKHFALGLHKTGRFDKVIDIADCLIGQNETATALDTLRTEALKRNIEPYNQRSHRGFLRNIVIRSGSDSLFFILVTSKPENDDEKLFIDWYGNTFSKMFPKDNILHAMNETSSPVANGIITVLNGREFISERILGVEYRISPFSFFQTNTQQLDRFVGAILDSAELTGSENVWDLYCGAGTISLPAARRAQFVNGIELVESSIADARSNAERNGISNAAFHAVDLHTKSIGSFLDTLAKPDVVVIDPPRAGMHPALLETICRTHAPLVVYISCNPATQARDCSALSEFYEIESIQPVDMFPQTFHVESIARMKKK